VSTEIRSGKKE